MTYPPQGGGYPDDNASQPQSYELYGQSDPYGSQPQSPAYGSPPPQPQPGYPAPQADPYGWGQPPQSPAPGYAAPQPTYAPQPAYAPAPPPPPSKSNGGVIAAIVVGGLVLVIGIVLAVVLINNSGSSSDSGTDGSSSSGSTDSASEDGLPAQSPTEVVNLYYDANIDRDWDEALSYLSKNLYDQFSGVSDADREAAADQYEGTTYTVTGETIADDKQTADVDVTVEQNGTSQSAVLKMVIEDGEWKIDEFAV